MNADDKRHGSYAGYGAGCRGRCCLDAYNRYRKHLDHDHARGVSRTIPAIGYRRRVQALQAMGWTLDELGTRLGIAKQNISMSASAAWVYPETHRAMVAVYDELSMKPGTSIRARRHAEKHGWVPPLAWDEGDLDNPDAPHAKPQRAVQDLDIDHVVIERVMARKSAKANRAERLELIRRWKAADRPINELDRLLGANIRRDIRTAA